MGDRTTVQLIVHACLPHHVRAFHHVIDEYGLFEGQDVVPHRIELGWAYMAAEVSCGSADEIASTLQSTAGDAAWTVWEDPKYEWLGTVTRHHPRLGSWSAECTSEGQGVFFADQIVSLLEDRPKLDELLGMAWRSELTALDETNRSVVIVEPNVFDVEWDRATGAGVVTGAGEDGRDLVFSGPAQSLDAEPEMGPVTAALLSAGWLLVDGEWTSHDRRGRMQHGEAYRLDAARALPAGAARALPAAEVSS